jgi:hypothetical protein
MAKPGRFGGRPGSKPKPGERVHLGFRVPPTLKRRLEQAAGHSTRSISAEAEFRMQQSFDKQDLLPEVLSLAYGRGLAGMLMQLGEHMHDAGITAAILKNGTTTEWLKDPDAFAKAIEAGRALLDTYRPKGDDDAR